MSQRSNPDKSRRQRSVVSRFAPARITTIMAHFEYGRFSAVFELNAAIKVLNCTLVKKRPVRYAYATLNTKHAARSLFSRCARMVPTARGERGKRNECFGVVLSCVFFYMNFVDVTLHLCRRLHTDFVFKCS